MTKLGGDSTLAYSLIDECFVYGRNLSLIAAVVGVVNAVSAHPGRIFTMQAQGGAEWGLAFLAVVMAVGAGVTAAHRIRLLAARRWPRRWSNQRNDGVMLVLFSLFTGTGFVFVLGVSKALSTVLAR